jgi:YD repeat-containing protein
MIVENFDPDAATHWMDYFGSKNLVYKFVKKL